jgi:hypothetical protein
VQSPKLEPVLSVAAARVTTLEAARVRKQTPFPQIQSSRERGQVVSEPTLPVPNIPGISEDLPEASSTHVFRATMIALSLTVLIAISMLILMLVSTHGH